MAGSQDFVATEGQVEFIATELVLNDDVAVCIEGALQSSSVYTRVGQIITLDVGVSAGTEVRLIN